MDDRCRSARPQTHSPTRPATCHVRPVYPQGPPVSPSHLPRAQTHSPAFARAPSLSQVHSSARTRSLLQPIHPTRRFARSSARAPANASSPTRQITRPHPHARQPSRTLDRPSNRPSVHPSAGQSVRHPPTSPPARSPGSGQKPPRSKALLVKSPPQNDKADKIPLGNKPRPIRSPPSSVKHV